MSDFISSKTAMLLYDCSSVDRFLAIITGVLLLCYHTKAIYIDDVSRVCPYDTFCTKEASQVRTFYSNFPCISFVKASVRVCECASICVRACVCVCVCACMALCYVLFRIVNSLYLSLLTNFVTKRSSHIFTKALLLFTLC